jgi:GH15 family glucan-1,4-alpha-glucosidase
MSGRPIADYAVVSDCNSAALVSSTGSVDWLCFPRFDSRSVFARLLDHSAGHFSVRPRGEAEATRRYVGESLVLETTFRTSTGAMVLLDGMAIDPKERGHELGRDAPHALLRLVRCTAGEVELEVEFTPRPEYGLVRPLLTAAADGVVSRGSPDVFALSSGLDFICGDEGARATRILGAGESVALALQYAPAGTAPRWWSESDIEATLDSTRQAWEAWSKMHQSIEGPWCDLVRHSGRVLQALTYEPTGAIVAAVTTSLPEEVGGERNWDYRYAWVRDASFTLDALWVAACPDEAYHFFAWMVDAAASDVRRGSPLQIVFGVGGEHDLTERELDHLSGWRKSGPVRVGNAAWRQHQLDVYGELLSAAHRLDAQLGELDEPMRQFFIDLADGAAGRWQQQDNGIWEVRGGQQHFVHSKVMCWVALDRAIALAERLGAGDRVASWEEARHAIRTAVETQGWSEPAGAYAQAFGSDVLDASVLMMPIVGFVPADAPRMRATIDAIASHLTDERGLVYRYRGADDGLPGSEGTFLLCTFWLAHCLALAGEVERAREVFERAIRFTNDVGLLSEEIDTVTGELLGNFPQALSHIGLVNAAWAISEAAEGRRHS